MSTTDDYNIGVVNFFMQSVLRPHFSLPAGPQWYRQSKEDGEISPCSVNTAYGAAGRNYPDPDAILASGRFETPFFTYFRSDESP